MHLDHAILGFLNHRPYTGYDLKRLFDRSIRHFWPADQSQIYRTLSRLAKQGLVEVEVVPQDNRPSRKVHRITQAGREEFRDWLGGKPREEEIREPFLIQIFFAGLLPDEEAIEILEAKAQELRELLRHFNYVNDEPIDKQQEEHPARERYFWYLTLDHGLWMTQAALDWMEDAIKRIRNKDYEQGGAVLPPPRRER